MKDLATFTDRYTMRYVRTYPHPVDRVWEAITDDEQVTRWMGFPVRFDLRVGGRCRWGADASYFSTEIRRLEPKTLIEHGHSPQDEGYMRFELHEHEDGCRLDFTHHFDPAERPWEEWPHDLGGDLPGGPDTPWRPGFVGGFHNALDRLGNLLDGHDPSRGERPKDELFGRIVDEWAKQSVEQRRMSRDDAERYARELRGVAYWNDLNEIYREHIRETIPPE